MSISSKIALAMSADGASFEEVHNSLEKLTDDFAKEVLRVYIGNKTLQYKQSQGDYSLDELLLIIKKEKGL
jgi:hypothetical protein